jgi:phosphomannomutase
LIAGDLRAQAERWIAGDPDEQDRAELRALLDDGSEAAAAELTDRFGARLEFGTAGLRGAIGAGPNRMNRAVATPGTGPANSPTRPPGCWPGPGSGRTCCHRSARPRCSPSRSGTCGRPRGS